MAVDFVLESFNSEFTAAEANLDGVLRDQLETDATSEIDLPINLFTDTFRFQSDATDLNDVESEDIRYLVTNALTDSLDSDSGELYNKSLLSNSKVTTGPIATVDANGNTYPHDYTNSFKMSVAADYMRYLSQRLFNTYLGVDLFANEEELFNSIALISHNDPNTSAESKIRETIKSILAEANDLANESVTGTTGLAESKEVNISRELLRQIKALAPQRLSELNGEQFNSPDAAVPLKVGDSINFKLSIDAATNQNTLTNVEPVPTRTYTIKINLVETSQPAPTTGEFVELFKIGNVTLHPDVGESVDDTQFLSDITGLKMGRNADDSLAVEEVPGDIIVFEDENNYYVKREYSFNVRSQIIISKSDVETLPSEITVRGDAKDNNNVQNYADLVLIGYNSTYDAPAPAPAPSDQLVGDAYIMEHPFKSDKDNGINTNITNFTFFDIADQSTSIKLTNDYTISLIEGEEYPADFSIDSDNVITYGDTFNNEFSTINVKIAKDDATSILTLQDVI